MSENKYNNFITFQFVASYLFKNIVNVLFSITSDHHYIFDKDGITIVAHHENQQNLGTIKISKENVNLKYSENISLPLCLNVSGITLKKKLDVIKKNDPVDIIIRQDSENGYNFVVSAVGQDSRSEFYCSQSITSPIDFKEPSEEDGPKIYTNTVKFSEFLSNVKSQREPLKIYVGDKFIMSIVKDKDKNKTFNKIGRISKEEQLILQEDDDVIDDSIPNFIIETSILKQLTKIYKHGPVLIYHEDGKSLLIKTIVSYIGVLNYYNI